MAVSHFGIGNFFIRLGFALVLVLATYNPSTYSFYHWLRADGITAPLGVAGMVLVVGWIMYIRATARSLGVIGVLVAVAFFGSILWLILDRGLISTDNSTAIGYILLLITSIILALGMSWSHIRRRASGQADVDEIEE